MYLGAALAESLTKSLNLGRETKSKDCYSQELQLAELRKLKQERLPLMLKSISTKYEELNIKEEQTEARLLATIQLIEHQRQPQQTIVEEILEKVNELEHTLYEDQQQESRLRMALEKQSERIEELNFSLDTEKQRNGRLVQLLRGLDAESSDDGSEAEQQLSLQTVAVYESISPMLMQQRYAELSASHRQSSRQLAKKDKTMRQLKCATEQLQAKYDHLFDEYRNEQRRFETLCSRYLQLQVKKKQESANLKDALGLASECIFHAQAVFADAKNSIDVHQLKKFNQNLECFMRALRNCCCLRKLQQLLKNAESGEQQKQQQPTLPKTAKQKIAKHRSGSDSGSGCSSIRSDCTSSRQQNARML